MFQIFCFSIFLILMKYTNKFELDYNFLFKNLYYSICYLYVIFLIKFINNNVLLFYFSILFIFQKFFRYKLWLIVKNSMSIVNFNFSFDGVRDASIYRRFMMRYEYQLKRWNILTIQNDVSLWILWCVVNNKKKIHKIYNREMILTT